jgi:hypothetical protein
MADSTDKKSEMTLAAPESQRQRWIHYGTNVGLSCLIVIALAFMITWMAQSRASRIDTTVGGSQSLRPQSVDFIQKLTIPIRIVALYPKLKENAQEQDTYQPVADLLTEYQTKGRNITTEVIDPDTEKDAFNKLVAEVTNKFGGEVKGYKAILDTVPDVNTALDKFLTDQVEKFKALPYDQITDQQLAQDVNAAYLTLVLAHQQLSNLKTAIDSDVNQQVPSYKDAVDDTRTAYSNMSQLLQQFSQVVGSFKTNPTLAKLPQFVAYGPAAAAAADDAKKKADGVVDQINKLPALTELDEFKQELKTKSIIVMSDSGYKILQADQVWQKLPESAQYQAAAADAQPRLSFDGEQQITAAIVSLTNPGQRMVVFVRAGGPPLASAQSPDQQPPFASIAARLREDNFDVEEKDASGQAAMNQENPMPEPTDAQLKGAIWVVVRFQNDTQPDQPSPLNSMLEEHLNSGGSALVMLFPTADSMEQALTPMGIEAKTDEVLVHEALPMPQRQSSDFVENAVQASQAVFKLNMYGDHPITTPLEGLDFLTAASVPIAISETAPAGVHATPLLPLPLVPHFWASADASSVMSADHPKVVFNPRPDPESGRMFGDIDNTEDNRLHAAAASESPNGARLVVVGSYIFAINYLVELPDQEMLEHGLPVARLPGNEAFFANSVLWLAHEDGMLAIGPHALQVPRIREMTTASLNFWRLGVLALGLPVLTVLGGIFVYARRHD